MKKICLLISVVLFALLVFDGCHNEGKAFSNMEEGMFMDEFNITKTAKEVSDNIFKEGCIKDELTASEMATSILRAVYGDDFDNGLPLLINYDEKEQCWLIKTQLPDGMDGGSKYIIIKKSNAEILGVWATK